MLATQKKNFLEKYDQTPLSKKENELLDRDFGYKNIDGLVDVFNNTKTNKQQNRLFDKINNELTTMKKLVNIVSNTTEKRRINNVIKSVEFTVDYFAPLGDSDGKSDSSIGFSDADGSGLRNINTKPNA